MADTQHTQKISEHREIVLAYLNLARTAYNRAGQDRAYWAALAREHGLTWRQIGDALGMSKSGARMLATRYQAET